MSAHEDFWRFSLRVYGQADVAEACLALQNDYGLDVNLLLYCCWLGTHGTQLDDAAFARAMAFAGPWSEHVVRPLRHARTWMKHDSDAPEKLPPDVYAELRESIKAIELEAERLEQLALETMTDPPRRAAAVGVAASTASVNLQRYIEATDLTPDADMRAYLATLIVGSTGSESQQAAQHLESGRVPGAKPNDD